MFSLRSRRTALVVGDVSGKGLEAAADVATVRNMLRAFLYTKQTLSEAVTELNTVLAINNLLAGFTTLFVSIYDAQTRQLTYANCGQEPALLRRTLTGFVEQLGPIGTIVGAEERMSFDQASVSLTPGDAVAIFSDGFTECGQSRREMLGIEGVTAILEQPLAGRACGSPRELAEELSLRLVAGMKEVSAGILRDDVCLLMCVAED